MQGRGAKKRSKETISTQVQGTGSKYKCEEEVQGGGARRRCKVQIKGVGARNRCKEEIEEEMQGYGAGRQNAAVNGAFFRQSE